MVKIAVDAGHGGKNSTPGKRSPDGEYEWNFNNKVLLSFIAEMYTYEKVELLRLDDPTGNTDVSLEKRTAAANLWKADVLLSFHHNANTGVWGNWTGTETYVHLNSSSENRILAQEIQKALVEAYNLHDRGVKSANFHVLRETNMPAILIEGGFMDSFIDIEKLRNDTVLRQVGQNVAYTVAKLKKLVKRELSLYNGSNILHKVLSGDTLWSLANKYEVAIEDLRKWNNLSTDLIFVGDVLAVSDGIPDSIKKIKGSVTSKSRIFPLPFKILRFGDSGVEVRQLQAALQAADFRLQGNIDGVFGPDTLQALRRFQSVFTPQEIDGVFGPKTRAALEKVVR